MSWCDKLASTPTVGLRFDDHHMSSAQLLDKLSPIFDGLVKPNGREIYSLTKTEPFSLEFNTDSGFNYGVGPARLFVGFSHKLKVRQVSGGAPTVDMLSDVKPYTALLRDVTDKLLQMVSHTTNLDSRKLRRIGVVSSTNVAEEELPPGFGRYIEYAGKPWKNGIEYFNLQLVSTIKETSTYTEICIHQLSKSENSEEQLINVMIDLQRRYIEGISVTQESLASEVESTAKSALSYFEELAIGNMFDENTD